MTESPRDHYSGALEPLADVFGLFASSPSVCKYDGESATTSKAKLVKEGTHGIPGSHELLAQLQKLQPNLSFTKMQVKLALELVFQRLLDEDATNPDKRKRWASRLTAKEKDDWVETIQRRTRNLCRVVAQGLLKSPKAPWVLALPWRRMDDTVREDTDTVKDDGDDTFTERGCEAKREGEEEEKGEGNLDEGEEEEEEGDGNLDEGEEEDSNPDEDEGEEEEGEDDPDVKVEEEEEEEEVACTPGG